ncbi:MAG: MetQ/NlpA family ABC transporter substrate-binding protein [Treponemataceae bacterium]|nr:MetQ/NlpA family ABC transporter substrate-binding protein [Treponemataceae bacterium]
MKKIILLAAAILAAASVFAAPKKKAKKDLNAPIVIGATPVPHVQLLELVKDDLAKQGVKLDIREMTDYVILNDALEQGELDANFDQHIPYLESTNADKGYHLVNAGGIHIEPFALYSKKYASLEAIPEKAKIAIPNDPTNGGRALLLLQSAGLIKLDPKAGITATPLDVKSNPKKFQFIETDAASLPRVLNDVDAAAINGNYALPAGLSAKKDGLFVEGADSPYVNVIAVKKGNENDARIMALVKALQSQKVRDWISTTYPNGEVVAAF